MNLGMAIAAMVLLLAPGWAVGDGAVLSVDVLLVLLLARWRRDAAGALFGSVLLWALVRSGGFLLMRQDPLLYDLVFLLRHLWVLGRDLFGGLATPLWALATLGFVCTWALGAWLVGRGRDAAPVRLLAGVAGVGTLLWAAGLPVDFGLGDLVGNLGNTVVVQRQVGRMLAAEPYRAYDGLELQRRPDLHVYIIESYGRLLTRGKPRTAWAKKAEQLNQSLSGDGLHSVSAFVTAPVSGGRSWLADASMLTGLEVAHESVFEQVNARIDRLPHLPRILNGAGYETVLVRPKDRARPGVALRNDLEFTTPVFFADLGYTGRPIGWGWIPDEYTLGWLRENRLLAEGRPRFLFAHLVSSHAPWQDVPEPVADWHTLNTGELDPAAEDSRPAMEELWVQLQRYQRRSDHRGKRRARGQHVERYQDAVHYDLDVVSEHLRALPDRPGVWLVLGDHQPPLVTGRGNFDVPVHVVSNDPALLKPWREAGFVDGWVLEAKAEPVATLAGLMSLSVSALAAADGQQLPWIRDGVTGR